jgi:hypothetical protein
LKTFYKILFISVLAGFLYLQYDLKSDTTNNIYTDSLQIKDTFVSGNDSLQILQVKLRQGKLLYEKKCQKCHMLYKPKDYKLSQWKENLIEMKEKAELTKDEYSLILGYLSANCKK